MTDGSKKLREALAIAYNIIIRYVSERDLNKKGLKIIKKALDESKALSSKPVVEGKNEDFEKACFYYGIEPKVCKVLSTFIDELRGELQHAKWMRENVEKENWGNYEKVVALQAEKAEIQKKLDELSGGYVKNCLIEPPIGGEVALFTANNDGVVPRLDGYAIVSRDRYEALQSKLSLAVDGLEKIADLKVDCPSITHCVCACRHEATASETLAKVKEK